MPHCYQLVPPVALRKNIMHYVHDKKLSGHLGVNKTVHNVRKRFYCPGHKEDIQRWCRKSYICASREPRSGAKRVPLQQRLTGDKLERIAMDILGPLPGTPNGNQYISVVSDFLASGPKHGHCQIILP